MAVNTVVRMVAFEHNEIDGSLRLFGDDGSELVIEHGEATVAAMLQEIFASHRRRANAIVEEAHASRGVRVVEVPHPDVDVKIALSPDVTLEEAAQAMRQLGSPASRTVAVEIPPEVRTAADFFEEDGPMARAFAQKLADELYGIDCSRCGKPAKKPVEVGARKLCSECAA